MKYLDRYVMKLEENQFVKWIQWTAGVIPTVIIGTFEKSLIVNNNYLKRLVKPTDKIVKELIKEYYPNVEFLKVKISIV